MVAPERAGPSQRLPMTEPQLLSALPSARHAARASCEHFATEGELQALYEAGLRRRVELFGAPQSVLETLMFALRERGIEALAQPNVEGWLADLSQQQVAEIITRLDRLRPRYPATITGDLLVLVGKMLR